MNKHREKIDLKQDERLKPDDMLWSLLSMKDILFLRKSFKDHEVVSFCLWVEDQILSQFLPTFSFKRFIKDIQSEKKLISKNFTMKSLSQIETNNFIDELLKLLDEKDSLLNTLMDFLYNCEVLSFYRKLSKILSPIMEVDIITVSKKIEKKSLSMTLTKKLEELARLEFAYWAERFVSSWYKDLSQEEDISIKGVPIGPIAEYDLITDLMSEFPEKYYWNQGDYNAV
ncbi:MAG: hypothetical protein JRE65_01085 [Deltaproteobacteria bacterium]|jgi:hypothetical protein|nr:hypothetical protein [Deltaproteobacteria bacterium]